MWSLSRRDPSGRMEATVMAKYYGMDEVQDKLGLNEANYTSTVTRAR